MLWLIVDEIHVLSCECETAVNVDNTADNKLCVCVTAQCNGVWSDSTDLSHHGSLCWYDSCNNDNNSLDTVLQLGAHSGVICSNKDPHL